MIDKELSELKNDIPDIDIKDFKSGIYQKYSNNQTTRKIYFPKVVFVSKKSTAFWYSCASTLIA